MLPGEENQWVAAPTCARPDLTDRNRLIVGVPLLTIAAPGADSRGALLRSRASISRYPQSGAAANRDFVLPPHLALS